ncbi:hypothetical protein HGRIS_006753 [Hohenbuehelia grisea]|uniref:Cytochrome P450 n=1 Tax=Hohenbuehelia grisea TaxID=104357 RepID=A0ABR3J9Y0_9AGAR
MPLQNSTALTIFAVVVYISQFFQGSGWLGSLKLALLASAALILFSFVATGLYNISILHPLSKFPGPLLNKLSNLKNAFIVLSGRRSWVEMELHAKYGTIVRTGPNTISINSLAAVGPIYAAANALDKSSAYQIRQGAGRGLFFMQSRVEHNARRRIWADAFSVNAIQGYRPALEKRTTELLECIEERRSADGVIDFLDCARHWAYDVMGDVTFGESYELNLMQHGDKGKLVNIGQRAMIVFEVLGQVPFLADLMQRLPVTKNIRRLYGTTHMVVDLRLKKPVTPKSDIAAHLIAGDDKGNDGLSVDDLRAEAIFAIQAGSDATGAALAVLFFYLLGNRAAYATLRAELDKAAACHDGVLDTHAITELPYLGAVVDEGIRLGAPFGGLPRVVPDEGLVLSLGGSLGSVAIPPGTIVSVPAHTQHVSEEHFWPEPLAFRPERWLPGGLGPGSRANRNAVLAFSFGPFGCLGRAFAVEELRVGVARLMLAYDMELAPSPAFDSERFLKGVKNMRTTVFAHPLLVVATRRKEYAG